MLQELKSGSGGALFLAFLFFLSSFPVFTSLKQTKIL